jgi:hypothetical protein
MPVRNFPVRPNLDQLRHQAKDLLRAIRSDDAEALAELREHSPKFPTSADAATVQLADAQFVLARSYGIADWPRLVTACRMTEAIRRGDVETVRALALGDPRLLVEDARGVKSNWGPPMSYAATLGQTAIVEMLRELGAADLQYAFGRACLLGHVETARRLHAMLGHPRPKDDELWRPAYTLNVAGTELLLELGARVVDERGKRLAPVAVVLETDSRNPAAKHRILELYVEHGLRLPDTPAMAVHRGRIDLLEEHLRRDAGLLARTFAHEEIYPPELGCHDEVMATHGTPLAGTTLLHLCADYGEIEIARWLLDRGMDVDAKAAVDRDGFGGHTALFGAVVSQANSANKSAEAVDAPFTRLLLDHGANPNARASLRKELHPGYEMPALHEYRDVTPLSWGQRFPLRQLVSPGATRLIAERAGEA